MVKPPPRDASLGWARCTACPYRHAPGAPCPRAGVWLVHSMCLACHRAGPGRYCRLHDTLWAFKGRHLGGNQARPPLGCHTRGAVLR